MHIFLLALILFWKTVSLCWYTFPNDKISFNPPTRCCESAIYKLTNNLEWSIKACVIPGLWIQVAIGNYSTNLIGDVQYRPVIFQFKFRVRKILLLLLDEARYSLVFYYIVESEILKNTQRDISISSLVKISIMWLFPICFWAWIFTIFCLGLQYIINRTLHGGLKRWLLSSSV